MLRLTTFLAMTGLMAVVGPAVLAAPGQQTFGLDFVPAVVAGINPSYQPLRATTPSLRVEAMPDALRQEHKIADYYTRSIVVRGIPIVSADKASDYALLECAYLLDNMFAHSPAWVMAAVNGAKARISVMSVSEYTMDLPESQSWQRDQSPKTLAFWDKRARGMGGLPDASCAEENLLNLESDPYKRENITIHEFAHTVASALKQADAAWYERLTAIYKEAMAEGRFAKSYAANNEHEYWAEGVQDWFDCNNPAKDSIHNGIWTREQLKQYDPKLAGLLAEAFGDGAWRYIRTDGKSVQADEPVKARPVAELAHLVGLDRGRIPAFKFENSPRVQAYREEPEEKK